MTGQNTRSLDFARDDNERLGSRDEGCLLAGEFFHFFLVDHWDLQLFGLVEL